MPTNNLQNNTGQPSKGGNQGNINLNNSVYPPNIQPHQLASHLHSNNTNIPIEQLANQL